MERNQNVPQGSVLGPLLFVIYINDLEAGISSDISKFPDDTKIARAVRNIEDTRRLQEDLNRLQDWSEKWKMQFHVNKCTIMSVGKENWPVEYPLSNDTLGKTRSARDLGVLQVSIVTYVQGNSAFWLGIEPTKYWVLEAGV